MFLILRVPSNGMMCRRMRPYVGRDRSGLLGATAFSKDKARLHVGDVLLAELPNGHRATLFLPLGCGVIALGDVTQTDLCLAAGGFRSPHPVQADRVAA